ncbi:MAG: DUF1552 domain-containing protein [Opitutaceae bacterium]
MPSLPCLPYLRPPASGILFAVFILTGPAMVAAASAPTEEVAMAEFQKTISPILQKNCYECHGDGAKKGGIAFDQLKPTDIAHNPDLWLKVLRNTRSQVMPPPGEPAPSAAKHSRSIPSRPADGRRTRAGIPGSYAQSIQVMFDMLHLAFQTDSTRVATFMIAGDGNNREFAEIGVNDGHHNLSHHGNKADWIEKVAKIDRFYVSQLAYFLEKMEQTKDIDGNSLLHNSQIVYGCANSDGNRHSHSNLPIILAGRAGGTLNPGSYTKFSDEPVTNLYLSMMDRVGGAQRIERFGDSTGRLAKI